MTMPRRVRGALRARRRIGAALAVAVAVAAVVGIVLAVQSPSATSASNSSPSAGAATVQRRDLVETDTVVGTLSYANPQTVYNRLSGTITWLPSIGQVIRPGEALFRVSGEPVILMEGTTPAYRDLSAADTAGPDILELNRDLVRLGYTSEGIVLDDVWQPATTSAVEVFQQSLGEAPTGILTLGQVVFLPGKQVVSAVDTTVGSTGGGSGSGGTPSSSASDTSPTTARPEFVSLATNTGPTGPTGPSGPAGPATGRRHKTPHTLAALLALLRAESAELAAASAELRASQAAHNNSRGGPSRSGRSNSPKSNGSGSGNSGSGSPSSGASSGSPGASSGANATAILQTSSSRLIATVDLDASKQSEARVGEKVSVQMPNGTTVSGTISAVSSVAQASSNSGNGGNNGNAGGNGSNPPTIPVTIALSGHINGAGLDQAAVSVNFAQAKATGVLSVPVTAILATPGGGYAVQAASSHRLIPVTTGLFAAGYVEISGAGIYPGLAVTDSQG